MSLKTIGLNKPIPKKNKETGVIAQEIKEILPDAVVSLESKVYNINNSGPIDHLLAVDKNRIFMENVGATQQLDRLVTSLDKRVTDLETVIAVLPSINNLIAKNEQKQPKKKKK